jgi:hypothetical protein
MAVGRQLLEEHADDGRGERPSELAPEMPLYLFKLCQELIGLELQISLSELDE